jgi:hypothetical protein
VASSEKETSHLIGSLPVLYLVYISRMKNLDNIGCLLCLPFLFFLVDAVFNLKLINSGLYLLFAIGLGALGCFLWTHKSFKEGTNDSVDWMGYIFFPIAIIFFLGGGLWYVFTTYIF